MMRLLEIDDLTRRFYDGLRRGDLATVTASISREDGLVWIGTDPKEWWTSYETMVTVFRDRLEPTGGFHLVDTDPRGYRHGDVAWVADQPALRRLDGTTVPLRVTAVAHREAKAWRFVQWHVSVGVSHEAAGGPNPRARRDAVVGSSTPSSQSNR